MSKFKKIIKNKRVLLLIAFLILSVLLINPTFSDGVVIKGVTRESAATQAFPNPIIAPGQTTKPTSREIIQSIDGMKIKNIPDYHSIVDNLEINQTITIKTNKNTYFVTTKPLYEETITSETELVEELQQTINPETNETNFELVNVTKNVTIKKEIGVEDIGLNVDTRAENNIRLGLDLSGGTRVLLEPEEEIAPEDLDIIIENIEQRLNVFGVSDIVVRATNDFFGNTFISVEVSGVSENQLRDLLTNQGKFEAKIKNEVIFNGGEDVLSVCRTAQCASIDDAGCQELADGSSVCGFQFSITISEDAAKRSAQSTKDLPVVSVGQGQDGSGYLSENLTLWLDNENVDQLRIGSGLKGVPVQDIQISGAGYGANKDAARADALVGMKRLQTILITGSLPTKLNLARTETISPVLGEGFLENAMLAGLLAILVVVVTVGVRYQSFKISVPMAITMLSEVVILLGFAAFIGWRIDMVAIAAIVIAIGSGVDDQIIITDETLAQDKNKKEARSWKQKLKKAFFIIMASYFTLVVAMVPLWFAGAGLLKGFALTTIIGVTIGVLITRPAFAAILETLVEK